MPIQKDLKRIVRSRMQKTGESYTAARLQIVKKKDADYARLAGMSEAAVKKATGRSWPEWIRILDNAGATSKQQMGAVMKALQAKVAGRADGKTLSAEVQKQLP